MDNTPHDPNSDSQSQNQERDLATLRVLGTFFLIMGGLVFIATYEAIGNTPAVIVSVVSSIVLLAVGSGMHYVARRSAKQGN